MSAALYHIDRGDIPPKGRRRCAARAGLSRERAPVTSVEHEARRQLPRRVPGKKRANAAQRRCMSCESRDTSRLRAGRVIAPSSYGR